MSKVNQTSFAFILGLGVLCSITRVLHGRVYQWANPNEVARNTACAPAWHLVFAGLSAAGVGVALDL